MPIATIFKIWGSQASLKFGRFFLRLLLIFSLSFLMTVCHTSSALGQSSSSGYNVSDYKPATLNDSYKPGQSIIFGNSGPAARAVSPQPASRTPEIYSPVSPAHQNYRPSTDGVGRSYSSRRTHLSPSNSEPLRHRVVPKTIPTNSQTKIKT